MRVAAYCALQVVQPAVLQRMTLMNAPFEGVLASQGCVRV